MNFSKSFREIKARLSKLPKKWEGKDCVLELKKANDNWRQMEWCGFYFKHKGLSLLSSIKGCKIPGEKIHNVEFDMNYHVNYSLRVKSNQSGDNKLILNDKKVMELALQKNGYHGQIIALCDVEYDDDNRDFQKWHTQLKGGLSSYEKERIKRKSQPRYRKARANLCEIIVVIIEKSDLKKLDVLHPGRNSNGDPRNPKYQLNIKRIHDFKHEIIKF